MHACALQGDDWGEWGKEYEILRCEDQEMKAKNGKLSSVVSFREEFGRMPEVSA